jgi:hypothetical protein
LGTALLYANYGVTVQNTLFEDCDDANTFRAFNPTQAFLHLKKILLLTCYRAQVNMLTIILIRNGYFFNIYIEIIYFLFFKIYFLYHHIKIIQKHKKKINLN